MTYHRFKAALQKIADGDVHPVETAREALYPRPRGPKPTAKPPRTPITELRRRRGELDLALLRDYIASGCPHFTKFSRRCNWTVHRVKRRLYGAARYIIKDGGNTDDATRAVAERLWRRWNPSAQAARHDAFVQRLRSHADDDTT